uniref:tRNA(Ile)-lysidine synthase n=1 Tax=Sphondylothamnion multifidum TaxID=193186 RepID=A0A4D6X1Y6_9FLOR|nr:tRNA Ile-lysidine synthetase [Sphondylothamnion multifidum]
MQTYFNQILSKKINPSKTNNLLVAISGGQDSLSLIKILGQFEKKNNIQNIEYIYIDHQWKQKSKQQTIHLINYLTMNKKIFIYQIEDNCFKEKIARLNRYQILVEHAIKNDYQFIITGHTQTDRIETFLYKLIRGTSLDGATSLTLHRKINNNLSLFRPLLYINRYYINWFCRKFCLPIWSDQTNHNLSIDRNRMRKELIPYIQKYFNIKMEIHLAQFLDICNEENEYIKQNTIKLYIKSRHPFLIALNYKQIQKQHTILQKRIIQLFIFHNYNILLTNKCIKNIISIIDSNAIFTKLNYKNLKIMINNCWIYII